jgi:hypothetical protein
MASAEFKIKSLYDQGVDDVRLAAADGFEGGDGFEPQGFGSQTPRFRDSRSQSPGPGIYFENQSLVLDSPSISKKGYSNAFVSKQKRLNLLFDDRSLWPYPGKYKLPGAMDYSSRSINSRGIATFARADL